MAQSLTPLAQFGMDLVTEPSDVNRDRTVNAFDLQTVAINLDTNVINLITPQRGLPPAASGVPEPTTGMLAAVAAIVVSALGWVRRARKPSDRRASI